MSQPQPRDGRRVAALALLAVLATGACVSPKGPGVGVRGLEADIVFGVKDDKAGDSVAPVPSSGGDIAGPQANAPTQEVRFLPKQPKSVEVVPEEPKQSVVAEKPKFFPSLRPANTCPAAGANTFADAPAPLNVTAAPAVGSYRWKKGGEAEFTLLPNQKFPIAGFEQRLVTQSAMVANSADNPAPALEFVYKIVQPDGDRGQAVTTYRVKTKAQSASVNVPASDQRARSGVPGRGVAIEKIERFDRNGGRIGEFAPTTPLLIFPLEVSQGETFTSSAVDAKTGDTVQIQAQIKDRVEVDACGKILSGWLVDGTRTISGRGTQPYKYVVAPQLGGMVISEEFTERTAEGTFARKFNIGQQDPDPLPEGTK